MVTLGGVTMNCIHCFSNKTVKNGHRGDVQLYKCRECKRQFCEKGIYARMEYDPFVVSSAMMLRMHRLSFDEVKYVLGKMLKQKPNKSTIFRWIKKFYPLLMHIEKLRPHTFTKIWHVDEKFIRVRGSKDPFAYLWVVADNKSQIIAVHVSNARTGENAKIVLRKARTMTNENPSVIITDGLQGYKKACKIFGRKTKHVKAHFKKKFIVLDGKIQGFSNNRIERINSDIDLFLHVFRGLKGFMTAQMWADLFRIWFNYCKPRKSGIEVEIDKIPELVINN